jgi:hypothetical protein
MMRDDKRDATHLPAKTDEITAVVAFSKFIRLCSPIGGDNVSSTGSAQRSKEPKYRP